jgi:hypothetical protein
MAPEVFGGGPHDAASDIWALGVLLQLMLSGKPPFSGATAFDMTAAILRDAATPLPTRVPAGLRSIVAKCLAKEPSHRYQRASEVRTALEAVQAEAPAVGTPAPSGRSLTRVWAGTRALLVAIVLLAVTWTVIQLAPQPLVRPHDAVTVVITDFETLLSIAEICDVIRTAIGILASLLDPSPALAPSAPRRSTRTKGKAVRRPSGTAGRLRRRSPLTGCSISTSGWRDCPFGREMEHYGRAQ